MSQIWTPPDPLGPVGAFADAVGRILAPFYASLLLLQVSLCICFTLADPLWPVALHLGVTGLSDRIAL